MSIAESLDGMRIVTVGPSNVDLEDTTYRVPFYGENGPMRESVRRFGIVNPPVIQQRPDRRWIAVLGRRRLEAAFAVGIDSCEAKALPDEITESEAFALALWDNLSHRSLDRAATAVVVKRLLDLFPIGRAAEEFLPALGVPSRGPVIERLRRIGGLPDFVLERLASGRILEKTAALMTDLREDDRNALLGVADELTLNANKTAEVVEHLTDLAMVGNTTIRELLADPECVAILDDPRCGGPEKAERFRELLRRRKFPEFTAREEEFAEWAAVVREETGAIVRPTQSFEDETVFVEITAASRGDAEALLSRLHAQRARHENG